MQDLSSLFEAWPYDEKQNIRIIIADDGRSLLQVRLPLGIEQYEMEGRPDGRRPDGFETVLEAIEHRLKQHIFSTGSDVGFEITVDEAERLHGEGILFYYRYLLLFQLSRYAGVVRDTEHNLHLCDLLERYCGDEESRNAVLQFRPYIIRMNAAAQAMAIHRHEREGDPEDVVRNAIEAIGRLEEIETPAFRLEVVRSTNYLRSLVRSFADGRASDADSGAVAEELQKELRDAIAGENYERAAQIRDQLRGDSDAGSGDVDKES